MFKGFFYLFFKNICLMYLKSSLKCFVFLFVWNMVDFFCFFVVFVECFNLIVMIINLFLNIFYVFKDVDIYYDVLNLLLVDI